jgi:hypothetical protein
VFEVDRTERPPLLVLWDHRDAFTGEADPPVPVAWPGSAPTATATDALGDAQDAEVGGGRVELNVSLTPVFVPLRRKGDRRAGRVISGPVGR